MQYDLLLKAITHGTVGIIFLTLLVVLLFALQKRVPGKQRLSGIVVFALVMLGLWSFVAFEEAYVSLRKMIVSQTSLRT